MNTKQLNLVEMSPKEMRETEGGIWPLLVLAAVALSGCVVKQGAVGKVPNTKKRGG